MKYEMTYISNDHIWAIEDIAAAHGYIKTQECYWVQIFEDSNGNSIITTRSEDEELTYDPVKRIADMLNMPPAEENKEEETEMKQFAMIEKRITEEAEKKTANTGTYYGTASGYGYDKESAAIADAFNKCDSILKALYQLKENGLRAGKTDVSDTACTGVNNRNICGYGAGYSVLPHFEGGVGVSCFWEILKKCGFETREHHSKHSDFYNVEKEVKNS